jgi:phospholipid/cholesterol/gamma-HCH transport system substrate-binding protein
MKKYSQELVVGVFVLLGLLAVAYMSIKLGKLNVFTDDYYTLKARFTDVTGLKVNAPVQMYGVEVGFVGAIGIDKQTRQAAVDLRIRKDIRLTDDAIAAIKTSGLIGDKYVRIAPGGLGSELKTGDSIFDTQAAIDIEDLISKYVFGKV